MADYPMGEVLAMPEYPKSKLIATVCSSKQQKHTQHYRRYVLTKYLAEQLPEFDWFGRGVRALHRKYEAIANNEYEKRLPAIREARRLIVTRYNLYARVAELIHEHMAKPESAQDAVVPGLKLCGRHRLRRRPLHALAEAVQLADDKLHAYFSPVKH